MERRKGDVIRSRSTLIQTAIGGVSRRAITRGDILELGSALPKQSQNSTAPENDWKFPIERLPAFTNSWTVSVTNGPDIDWLSEDDRRSFLEVLWAVSPRSNRIGVRLDGPAFEFSNLARNKPDSCGSHPSNKIDYGCPEGAVLICGQTPTVLLADAPSLTGYMTPFVVPTAEFWKLGQTRPGDKVRFTLTSVEESLEVSRHLEALIESF